MLSAARREWALILLLTLLVLLLPTRNSTSDAWYYAACVRHGHDLLLPHHLLYNAVGWLWLQLLGPLGPDALAALLALNALAYGGVLLGLRGILHQLGAPSALRLALLLLAGGSFGLLRFATENETYMLPLLLSVLASGSWLRYLRAGRAGALLAAGGWAAGACLLHQLHAWWWLGLLIGTLVYAPHRRAVRWFLAPALLIPLAYGLALAYWQLPLTPTALLRFALHDFVSGSAGAPASAAKALLLTVANLVRSFAQVHGSTLALVRRLPWLALVPLLGLVGVVWAWRRRSRSASAAGAESTAPPTLLRAAGRTHGLILLLHLGFAAWASGNAEFMVMLPVLLAVVLTARPRLYPQLPATPLLAAGAALLAWNLAFGLLPSHLLDYTNLAPLLRRVQQEPGTWFLLDNHNLALNRLHYLTGRDGQPNVLPAPALLAQQRHWRPAQLQAWLRAQQQAGRRLSTDALGGPQLLDRARLLQSNADAELLRGFHQQRRDSFPTFFGPRYLTDLR
ncbi:hypothetical protein EJV47_26820 [Hymenobacter gummosus]|uniref:Glycosyltransferase RgtA/B/C/D-like domain-containing protein n=1 Tax=Hymenobacter gummosus TaxID=1776032 RepID=A0A431TV62_9BACT|nr:hypothetical protein [Hymenobacter gummosus]RTQ44984.1 hypothetical protein EJV47_26820 [Hymenobacter gummosus]